VPPPALIVAIAWWIAPLSLAGRTGTSQMNSVSQLITPTSLRSSSRSTTRCAASLARSSFVTFSSVDIAIEPERSIESTTARLGISTFCLTSIVTGSASSTGVR